MPDPSNLCDRAAEDAARSTGVPVTVLYAITRAETGRGGKGGLAPWPWTVNMEGTGRWFDSASEARAYVEQGRARGARSFDIGCFQINHLWHGQAFESVEDMFDPARNARYAAEFLKSLFADTGSWTAAAGAYHSRTPDLSKRYADRFTRIHDALIANGAPSVPDTPPRVARQGRDNPLPLLVAGQKAGNGSLVPLAQDAPSPLFSSEPRVLY
ncbi:transglycosylase SLT domain-containing protein [Defluviimonas sp. WL0002]|uniref:Transglycosylase SLT domain-containing protein n=1 Tax=Albidovulum marisflavi TaxID=2984159 RepID=A0ABT2Z7H6_9RHOB|nr:transglycosylase SLT domain-containing protein [Defluviimonas sp. WL0002]MCV2867087.1 transglycosylase SLT domain-containing protein [Defluviimonas sp. WL0002]